MKIANKSSTFGRAAGSSLRIHHAMQQQPVANSSTLAKQTGISLPSVLKSLDALQTLGIVRELTGRKRNRIFSYAGYVRILSEGTEPL